VNNHFKHVSEFTGWYNFYHQMLVGDTIDNVVGVTGVGKKNAERILKGATNRADLHQRVENEYKRVYGSDWDRVMLENGRLLYLQRKEGDVWNLCL
jgi:5'-3' exonuclease